MYCYFILKIPVQELKKHSTAHLSTIYRWIEKYKNINWENIKQNVVDFEKIMKIKRKRYFKKSYDTIKLFLESYLEKHKFIDVKYIIRQIKKKFNIKIQKSTIYDAIKKLNYTYKKVKNSKIAIKNLEEHINKVVKFKNRINEEIKNRKEIWSLDESAFYINMLNEYGWSKKGETCIHNPINNVRKRYSLLLVISNKSVIKYNIYEGSINGNHFNDFFDDMNIKENTKVILDNFRTHTSNVIKNHKNYKNLLYNVPYNPETNPIEMAFSKIKSYVKKRNNSTKEKLFNNIIKGIKSLRVKDLNGYFNKSFN